MEEIPISQEEVEMAIPVIYPSSSMNQPASVVGPAPASMQYMAQRLIDHGAGDNARLRGNAGKIRVPMLEYTSPIYSFKASYVATPEARLASGWKKCYFFAAGWSIDQSTYGNVPLGSTVVVRKNMQAALGEDRILIVEDLERKITWSYWRYGEAELTALHPTNVFAGLFDPAKNPRAVMGGATVAYPYSGLPKDPRSGSGPGLNRRAMINTIEEIQSGTIRHVASLMIAATWYADTTPGTKGVDYLEPVLRCEWDRARYATRNRDGVPLDPDRRKLSLQGLRVHFPIGETRRLAWVRTYFPHPGPWRNFWDILTRQWCDYGFLVNKTGGPGSYGMLVEMTGMRGPDRAGYEAYGWNLAQLSTQEYAAASFMNDFRADARVVRPAP